MFTINILQLLQTLRDWFHILRNEIRNTVKMYKNENVRTSIKKIVYCKFSTVSVQRFSSRAVHIYV